VAIERKGPLKFTSDVIGDRFDQRVKTLEWLFGEPMAATRQVNQT